MKTSSIMILAAVIVLCATAPVQAQSWSITITNGNVLHDPINNTDEIKLDMTSVVPTAEPFASVRIWCWHIENEEMREVLQAPVGNGTSVFSERFTTGAGQTIPLQFTYNITVELLHPYTNDVKASDHIELPDD
jgi:hypothetical protein